MADYYLNSDYFGCDTLGRRHCCADSEGANGISYTVVAEIGDEPVTVEFFKEHARIDFLTDDNLIAAYIKSARQYLEQWSQLSFLEKQIRFMALRVPNRWRLMFGPYSADDSLFGDILKEGGTEIDITLTAGIWQSGLPENIRIAIALEAASQYMIREGVMINENGTVQQPDDNHDRALKLVRQYANITFP